MRGHVCGTHFKHLQREVEEPGQWGVEVGLARGGANAVGRRQQQQEGDALSQLHHLLAVETEVAGLQTQKRAHMYIQKHTQTHMYRQTQAHA